MRAMSQLDHSAQETRIKGLFGNAIGWLLKLVAPKAFEWAVDRGKSFLKKHEIDVKGEPYDFEMSRGSEDEDIEENPGPVIKIISLL